MATNPFSEQLTLKPITFNPCSYSNQSLLKFGLVLIPKSGKIAELWWLIISVETCDKAPRMQGDAYDFLVRYTASDEQ